MYSSITFLAKYSHLSRTNDSIKNFFTVFLPGKCSNINPGCVKQGTPSRESREVNKNIRVLRCGPELNRGTNVCESSVENDGPGLQQLTVGETTSRCSFKPKRLLPSVAFFSCKPCKRFTGID